jgi:hypothetical protein
MTLASTLPFAAACLVVLPGCGARSDLESAPPASACKVSVTSGTSGPPAQCAGWLTTGAFTTVSEPVTTGDMAYLTGMVPSAGGALITWFTLDDAPTSTWRTRAIGFDGTPRSAIGTHLSFPTMGGVYVGAMFLAGTGCAFAGLADDVANGCRFVPLDDDGAGAGPVVTVGSTGAGCVDLGVAPGGYSFVTVGGNGGPPLDLVTLSAAGTVLATTSLPAPDLGYEGRLVLRDGSFLLTTSEETDGGGEAAAVQHFSAGGEAIAAAVQLTGAAASILPVAQTGAGVMAAWLEGGASLVVQPLDEDGHAVGAEVPVAATDHEDLYGFTLAGTPGGDVIVAWFDLDGASSFFDLHVQALGPDGTPRGAPNFLGSFETLGDVDVLVDGGGQDALLVVTGATMEFDYGVLAVPLACAP